MSERIEGIPYFKDYNTPPKNFSMVKFNKYGLYSGAPNLRKKQQSDSYKLLIQFSLFLPVLQQFNPKLEYMSPILQCVVCIEKSKFF